MDFVSPDIRDLITEFRFSEEPNPELEGKLKHKLKEYLPLVRRDFLLDRKTIRRWGHAYMLGCEVMSQRLIPHEAYAAIVRTTPLHELVPTLRAILDYKGRGGSLEPHQYGLVPKPA